MLHPKIMCMVLHRPASNFLVSFRLIGPLLTTRICEFKISKNRVRGHVYCNLTIWYWFCGEVSLSFDINVYVVDLVVELQYAFFDIIFR